MRAQFEAYESTVALGGDVDGLYVRSSRSQEGEKSMKELKEHDFLENRNALDLSEAKTFRPKRRTDVRTRVVEGETVVLDRREEFVHQFNKTASYIWERCNGFYTAEEITRDLCQLFDVDFQTAHRDVLVTVERFQQARLLEVA